MQFAVLMFCPRGSVQPLKINCWINIIVIICTDFSMQNMALYKYMYLERGVDMLNPNLKPFFTKTNYCVAMLVKKKLYTRVKWCHNNISKEKWAVQVDIG